MKRVFFFIIFSIASLCYGRVTNDFSISVMHNSFVNTLLPCELESDASKNTFKSSAWGINLEDAINFNKVYSFIVIFDYFVPYRVDFEKVSDGNTFYLSSLETCNMTDYYLVGLGSRFTFLNRLISLSLDLGPTFKYVTNIYKTDYLVINNYENLLGAFLQFNINYKIKKIYFSLGSRYQVDFFNKYLCIKKNPLYKQNLQGDTFVYNYSLGFMLGLTFHFQ